MKTFDEAIIELGKPGVLDTKCQSSHDMVPEMMENKILIQITELAALKLIEKINESKDFQDMMAKICIALVCHLEVGRTIGIEMEKQEVL